MEWRVANGGWQRLQRFSDWDTILHVVQFLLLFGQWLVIIIVHTSCLEIWYSKLLLMSIAWISRELLCHLIFRWRCWMELLLRTCKLSGGLTRHLLMISSINFVLLTFTIDYRICLFCEIVIIIIVVILGDRLLSPAWRRNFFLTTLIDGVSTVKQILYSNLAFFIHNQTLAIFVFHIFDDWWEK